MSLVEQLRISTHLLIHLLYSQLKLQYDCKYHVLAFILNTLILLKLQERVNNSLTELQMSNLILILQFLLIFQKLTLFT